MFERSLHLPGMMQKYRNSTRSDRWKRGSCKSAGISLVFARIRRSLEKMMQMRSNFVTFPLTLLKLLHFCRNAAGAIAAPPYKARLGATGAMLLPLCKAAQLGATGAMLLPLCKAAQLGASGAMLLPLARLHSWALRALCCCPLQGCTVGRFGRHAPYKAAQLGAACYAALATLFWEQHHEQHAQASPPGRAMSAQPTFRQLQPRIPHHQGEERCLLPHSSGCKMIRMS